MRRTFKRIGIGLLTTALVVTGIPAGKVSAMAEAEPVVHEALDPDREDEGSSGDEAGTGSETDGEAGAESDGGEAGGEVGAEAENGGSEAEDGAEEENGGSESEAGAENSGSEAEDGAGAENSGSESEDGAEEENGGSETEDRDEAENGGSESENGAGAENSGSEAEDRDEAENDGSEAEDKVGAEIDGSEADDESGIEIDGSEAEGEAGAENDGSEADDEAEAENGGSEAEDGAGAGSGSNVGGSMNDIEDIDAGGNAEEDASDETDPDKANADDKTEETEDTAELLEESTELLPYSTGISQLSISEPEINDEGAYVYEAEDYYEREEGILSDGDVIFCDMQPGESITIPVHESMESGTYQFAVRSNGNRTEFKVYVNDEYIGTITRSGTDWDAKDLTDDCLEELLILAPGDEIRISAPADYGKVDCVILTAVEGQPFEEQDAESGIIVSAEPGVVPAESVLLVDEPDGAELEEICRSSGIDCAEGTFFHISLIDGAGSTVEPEDGEVTVKIPLPDGYQANAVQPVLIAEDDTVTELDGTLQDGQLVIKTDRFGIFGILDTRVVIAGRYVFEAENYYSGNIQSDNGMTFCDMQPGETITVPVDDQKLPEGNYRLTVSSNGTRTGYSIFINGIPAGTVKRTATGWNAADLTEDECSSVFHLAPGDELQIAAPVNKWEDDGSLYGKLDFIMLEAADEEPEEPGLLEQVVLHSEDWYFGKTDDAGGVNLRPQDQIDYFIRTEDGFGEEENKYQLTVCAGGFRTQYTVLVNGEEIGSLTRPNTEWGELNDTMLGQMVTLKAGDILTIYAEESWGTVADITLDRIRVQEPYRAVDAASGIVVTAEPGVVPEDSRLNVVVPDEAELDMICGSYSIDRSKGTFYRISLTDSLGSQIQTLGAVRAEIPVPDGYAEDGMTVFRITEDGYLEPWDFTVENGRICVEEKELGLIVVFDSVGSIRTLQAEDYYENTSGIQTDGNVKLCDVQPGEAVNFLIPEDMEEGYYALIVSSNGTRTLYTVSVNGKVQGVIRRGESGWGATDLTKDSYQGALKLKAGDTLTLTASANLNEGDSPTYGKLDAITLAGVSEPEPYEELDEITLSAADWYGGTQDSSGGMNIRPGDGIDFAIREQDGFTEGDYVIAVRACGFRKSYTVRVNGQPVMELPVRNSEWGVYLTGTSLVTVHLTPGDVVTFYEAESWGCIDTVTFYKDAVPAGNSMADRTGGRIKAVNYEESAGAKASGTEPVFIYQAEGYYQKQTDNPAADLQPGEQIEITLADNENFVDGLYQVTVASCGTRDHMFVKVNGMKTGRIDRKPGGYGMDQMTRDRLAGTVTLRKGDLLCIEAAPSEWGWVDYIRLDLVQKSEEESQGRRYEYQAVNYYGKKQAEWDVADLQPGEKIELAADRDDFEEGYYYVSVTSCGGRKKMEVEINGQQAGWIQRNSNNYGIRSLTRDTMPVPVYIRRGDRIAICAPSDGGWAWVDRIDLIKAGK